MRALLGVTFDEIGIEARTAGVCPRRSARACGERSASRPRQAAPVRWLRAITNYSTEVADALTAQNMADGSRETLLVDIANRYSSALNTDAGTAAAMSLALANEEAATA